MAPPARHSLEQILRIARLTSSRGEGLSLLDAIDRAGYASLRSGFRPADLVPVLRAQPSLVQDWLLFSADKRTSGGWYVTEEPHVVGSIDAAVEVEFGSIEEAVAEFVVRELDQAVALRESGRIGGRNLP